MKQRDHNLSWYENPCNQKISKILGFLMPLTRAGSPGKRVVHGGNLEIWIHTLFPSSNKSLHFLVSLLICKMGIKPLTADCFKGQLTTMWEYVSLPTVNQICIKEKTKQTPKLSPTDSAFWNKKFSICPTTMIAPCAHCTELLAAVLLWI